MPSVRRKCPGRVSRWVSALAKITLMIGAVIAFLKAIYELAAVIVKIIHFIAGLV